MAPANTSYDSTTSTRADDRTDWSDSADRNPQIVSRDKELSPTQTTWQIIAAGAVIPLGLAAAATVATYLATEARIAVAAWVAVAIVGTASVIATAAASRRRTRSTERVQ